MRAPLPIRKGTRWAVAAVTIGVLAAVGVAGWRLTSRLARWRHLDATYAETFAAPSQLAPDLARRRVTFHMKTGLRQDDSQICVGFNIIYAALEAGADVAVLFDAAAVLDLKDEQSRLHNTAVPLRLRKVIAAQMNRPLEEAPADYGAYLDLLHEKGARVYANTAMLVVTGEAEKVERPLPAFPYLEPAPYATVARLLTSADTVVVY